MATENDVQASRQVSLRRRCRRRQTQRIFILKTEAERLKHEVLPKLPHKFSSVLSNAIILDEVLLVLRAICLVDDVELQPLVFGDKYPNQQTRMLKLFQVFESKDPEIIKEFLTALCNLRRIPKASRHFRDKIEECFPGSVQRMCIPSLFYAQQKVNGKRASREMDPFDVENLNIKRSRSSSSVESDESVSKSFTDLIEMSEVSKQTLAGIIRSHTSNGEKSFLIGGIERPVSLQIMTDSSISIDSFTSVEIDQQRETLESEPLVSAQSSDFDDKSALKLQIQTTEEDGEPQRRTEKIELGFWQMRRFKKLVRYSLYILVGAIGAGGVYLYKQFVQRNNQLQEIHNPYTTYYPTVAFPTFTSTDIPIYTRILEGGNIKYTYGKRS